MMALLGYTKIPIELPITEKMKLVFLCTKIRNM